MTIVTTTNKVTYTGNGLTKEFSYSFELTDTSDMKVYLTEIATDTVTEVTTNFSVDNDEKKVTYPVVGDAIESTHKITLLREVPYTQGVDLGEQGPFSPVVIEEALDKLTMQAIQIKEEVDRAIKYGVSETEGTDPDEFISEINEAVVAAQTAQTNAETAETASETAQGLSEAARDLAQGYATAAQTAKTNAETAQGLAEDARDLAQGYASTAGSAKDDAETAETNAETAQGLAEDARDLAQGYASTAGSAKDDAESARDLAQGYASDASGYADDALAYYTAMATKELVKIRNATGGAITGKVVKCSGDYSTDDIPLVSAIASYTDRAIAYVDSLADSTNGEKIKRGRLTITGFDCSGASVGDKVYCDDSGDLTLTPTSMEVGVVIDNASNGVVYFNIGGAGGGSSLPGDNQRLSAMDIDGTTNAIDTDKALYTSSDYIEKLRLTICNRNGGYNAKVRVAHIDGGIGDIADEDYILYDDYLLPYETKIIEIDGLIPTDTILVRSNITNVNFVLTGEVMLASNDIGRAGAIEIDGSTKTVDADYEVFTATADGKYNVLICNRNPADPVEVQLAIIDSDDVADIADEDRMFFSLDNSQTIFVEGEFNLAINEMIAFRSDTADVNCIVYRVE